ncbi:MarR family winged helix-turn-helix transcriptional regulator [Leifsonia sp. Root112D2]|jgi:DNA-binding MarR family transcriptional regulator|uniref:MarR family winged helix-turn-helix transcriptional regulator n=1 Tax=Leifsonia sp. Root112D2 TaxID=1736426 RepID=UPI0006FF568E|nr:MarR family transcriptional regulator [Leifsonia sp. Root112D2]KQV07245.1 MarR family transcriptional regulator [Leifsonia sp. Root112D2]
MTAQPTTAATLLYLTKQLELAMRYQLDDVADAEKLTSLQYTALTVLERHPGLTSAELARNSFVRAQTMAQMVNTLEGRGLIERKRDPASRRQYLLALTDEGARVLDRLREPVADIEKRMVAGLGDAEVAAFRRALRFCRVALGGGQAH